MSASSRALLIIYYNFPPVKVPGAVRVYNLCKTGPSYFPQIYGLSTSNRRYVQQDLALAVPEVPVTEVPAWDIRRLARLRRSSDDRPYVSGAVKASRWGRWLRRLVDSFPFNILIGDGGLIYILRGYWAGKRLIRERGITHVFSTFRPYSDHVIAHLLKRKFPDLIWVADFRDLHLDEKDGRQLFWWDLQLWCNKYLLAKTDLICTVSKGLEKKLADTLGRRPVILRNGVPEIAQNPASSGATCFSIVYTGRIYPGEQTAELLFQAIAELIGDQSLDAQKVRLIYAGPTPEYWKDWSEAWNLEPLCDIRGVIPLPAARQLQGESAINLSLSYSSAGQQGDISSKIYEYLASGNAILAIVKGEKDGELEDFFDKLQAGTLIYHDPEELGKLKQFILDRYRAWASGERETWPENREALQELSIQGQYNAFFQLLDQLQKN